MTIAKTLFNKISKWFCRKKRRPCHVYKSSISLFRIEIFKCLLIVTWTQLGRNELGSKVNQYSESKICFFTHWADCDLHRRTFHVTKIFNGNNFFIMLQICNLIAYFTSILWYIMYDQIFPCMIRFSLFTNLLEYLGF